MEKQIIILVTALSAIAIILLARKRRLKTTRQIFLRSLFEMLGYLSYTDKSISIGEMSAAERQLKRLQLSDQEREDLYKIYRSTSTSAYRIDINKTILDLKRSCRRNPTFKTILFSSLYTIAEADQHVTARELSLIKKIESELKVCTQRKTNPSW